MEAAWTDSQQQIKSLDHDWREKGWSQNLLRLEKLSICPNINVSLYYFKELHTTRKMTSLQGAFLVKIRSARLGILLTHPCFCVMKFVSFPAGLPETAGEKVNNLP